MPLDFTGSKSLKASKPHENHDCWGCCKDLVKGDAIIKCVSMRYGKRIPVYICQQCKHDYDALDDVIKGILVKGDIAYFSRGKK